MENFVHVLIMACMWDEAYYVALQSIASQWYSDVYLKRAADLRSAMTTATKWVKQSYKIPWTKALYYVFYDTCGAEILLWQNNFVHELGLTMGYRYVEDPGTWYYANVVVPSMKKSKMQVSYLQWGYAWKNYVTKCYYETDPDEDNLPYFYVPKTASIEDVDRWVLDDATTPGYERLLPFFRAMLVYYRNKRW